MGGTFDNTASCDGSPASVHNVFLVEVLSERVGGGLVCFQAAHYWVLKAQTFRQVGDDRVRVVVRLACSGVCVFDLLSGNVLFLGVGSTVR